LAALSPGIGTLQLQSRNDLTREFREAEDQEFDCLFAEQMILHHEGAIEMAEEIIAVQREEIEVMECWRDDRGC
jgi:uncharacterized protein (DUF305 family)